MNANISKANWAALFLLVGAVIGAMVGRFLSSPPASASQPLSPSAVPDMTPALNDLQQAIEGLRADLAMKASEANPSPSSREPVGQPAPDFAKLTGAIETLNSLLFKKGVVASNWGANSEAWRGPGFASRADLAKQFKEMTADAPVSASEEIAKEIAQLHLGWTRNELFERYGAPTLMKAGPQGLAITYRMDELGQGHDMLVFQTFEGLVTGVDVLR